MLWKILFSLKRWLRTSRERCKVRFSLNPWRRPSGKRTPGRGDGRVRPNVEMLEPWESPGSMLTLSSAFPAALSFSPILYGGNSSLSASGSSPFADTQSISILRNVPGGTPGGAGSTAAAGAAPVSGSAGGTASPSTTSEDPFATTGPAAGGSTGTSAIDASAGGMSGTGLDASAGTQGQAGSGQGAPAPAAGAPSGTNPMTPPSDPSTSPSASAPTAGSSAGAAGAPASAAGTAGTTPGVGSSTSATSAAGQTSGASGSLPNDQASFVGVNPQGNATAQGNSSPGLTGVQGGFRSFLSGQGGSTLLKGFGPLGNAAQGGLSPQLNLENAGFAPNGNSLLAGGLTSSLSSQAAGSLSPLFSTSASGGVTPLYVLHGADYVPVFVTSTGPTLPSGSFQLSSFSPTDSNSAVRNLTAVFTMDGGLTVSTIGVDQTGADTFSTQQTGGDASSSFVLGETVSTGYTVHETASPIPPAGAPSGSTTYPPGSTAPPPASSSTTTAQPTSSSSTSSTTSTSTSSSTTSSPDTSATTTTQSGTSSGTTSSPSSSSGTTSTSSSSGSSTSTSTTTTQSGTSSGTTSSPSSSSGTTSTTTTSTSSTTTSSPSSSSTTASSTTSSSSSSSSSTSSSTTSTNTSLTSSSNPAGMMQAVTLTATVTAAGGTGSPSGSVTFMDGPNTLGTGTLNGGTATYTTTMLGSGSHSITAAFNGGPGFGSSTSAALMETISKMGTSMTLTPSTSSPAFGQPVAFTATVQRAGSTMSNPTGTVAFKDGTTTLGTVSLALVNGTPQASYTASSLSAGNHTITASYSGDTTFAINNVSNPLTVTPAATTTTVSASAAAPVSGQAVTFTATVASGSGTPTGTVTFVDQTTGATLGTANLSGGTASVTTSALAVGSHTVTASYGGGGNFGASSGSAAVTVNPAATSTALAASPAGPAVFGQSVTLTVTVSAVAPGSGTPAGTVTFQDGSATLGTASLIVVNGAAQATYTTSALSVGSHSLSAAYGGSSAFSASSAALTQTVNPAPTGTALSAAPAGPSVFGQPVTFTATVTPTAGSATPDGTVTFADGATTLGTVALGAVNGTAQATFTAAGLAVGQHTVTATYNGSGNFVGSSASAAQTVNPAATTTGVSVSASGPSWYGQPLTFTATVGAAAPGAGTPDGTITFLDGTTALGSATLASVNGQAQATLTTATLPAGGHTITVAYAGSSSFTASSSPALTQTVNQASTSTSVTASANPAVSGQPVTLTATVAPQGPGGGAPTGSVVFEDGTTVLGSGTLAVVNGAAQASFTASSLSVGTHALTAVYGGDANFVGSNTPLSLPVQAATTTTLSVSGFSQGGGVVELVGQPVTLTATVAATDPTQGTPTGSVTFYDGATALGTANLDATGSAAWTTTALGLGNHALTAVYNPAGTFAPSNSAGAGTGTQVLVNPDSGTFTLSEQITVTYHLHRDPGTSGAPGFSSDVSGTVALTLTESGTYDSGNFLAQQITLDGTGTETFHMTQEFGNGSFGLMSLDLTGSDTVVMHEQQTGFHLATFTVNKTGSETYHIDQFGSASVPAGPTGDGSGTSAGYTMSLDGSDVFAIDAEGLSVAAPSSFPMATGMSLSTGALLDLTRLHLTQSGTETAHLEQTGTQSSAAMMGGAIDSFTLTSDSTQKYTEDLTSLDASQGLHLATLSLTKTGTETYHLDEDGNSGTNGLMSAPLGISANSSFTLSADGNDTFSLNGMRQEANSDFSLANSNLNVPAVQSFLNATSLEAHGSFALSSFTLTKGGTESYQLDQTADNTTISGTPGQAASAPPAVFADPAVPAGVANDPTFSSGTRPSAPATAGASGDDQLTKRLQQSKGPLSQAGSSWAQTGGDKILNALGQSQGGSVQRGQAVQQTLRTTLPATAPATTAPGNLTPPALPATTPTAAGPDPSLFTAAPADGTQASTSGSTGASGAGTGASSSMYGPPSSAPSGSDPSTLMQNPLAPAQASAGTTGGADLNALVQNPFSALSGGTPDGTGTQSALDSANQAASQAPSAAGSGSMPAPLSQTGSASGSLAQDPSLTGGSSPGSTTGQATASTGPSSPVENALSMDQPSSATGTPADQQFAALANMNAPAVPSASSGAAGTGSAAGSTASVSATASAATSSSGQQSSTTTTHIHQHSSGHDTFTGQALSVEGGGSFSLDSQVLDSTGALIDTSLSVQGYLSLESLTLTKTGTASYTGDKTEVDTTLRINGDQVVQTEQSTHQTADGTTNYTDNTLQFTDQGDFSSTGNLVGTTSLEAHGSAGLASDSESDTGSDSFTGHAVSSVNSFSPSQIASAKFTLDQGGSETFTAQSATTDTVDYPAPPSFTLAVVSPGSSSTFDVQGSLHLSSVSSDRTGDDTFTNHEETKGSTLDTTASGLPQLRTESGTVDTDGTDHYHEVAWGTDAVGDHSLTSQTLDGSGLARDHQEVRGTVRAGAQFRDDTGTDNFRTTDSGTRVSAGTTSFGQQQNNRSTYSLSDKGTDDFQQHVMNVQADGGVDGYGNPVPANFHSLSYGESGGPVATTLQGVGSGVTTDFRIAGLNVTAQGNSPAPAPAAAPGGVATGWYDVQAQAPAGAVLGAEGLDVTGMPQANHATSSDVGTEVMHVTQGSRSIRQGPVDPKQVPAGYNETETATASVNVTNDQTQQFNTQATTLSGTSAGTLASFALGETFEPGLSAHLSAYGLNEEGQVSRQTSQNSTSGTDNFTLVMSSQSATSLSPNGTDPAAVTGTINDTASLTQKGSNPFTEQDSGQSVSGQGEVASVPLGDFSGDDFALAHAGDGEATLDQNGSESSNGTTTSTDTQDITVQSPNGAFSWQDSTTQDTQTSSGGDTYSMHLVGDTPAGSLLSAGLMQAVAVPDGAPALGTLTTSVQGNDTTQDQKQSNDSWLQADAGGSWSSGTDDVQTQSGSQSNYTSKATALIQGTQMTVTNSFRDESGSDTYHLDGGGTTAWHTIGNMSFAMGAAAATPAPAPVAAVAAVDSMGLAVAAAGPAAIPVSIEDGTDSFQLSKDASDTYHQYRAGHDTDSGFAVTSFVSDTQGPESYQLDQEGSKTWNNVTDSLGSTDVGSSSFVLSKDAHSFSQKHTEGLDLNGQFAVTSFSYDENGGSDRQRDDTNVDLTHKVKDYLGSFEDTFTTSHKSTDSSDTYSKHREGQDLGGGFSASSFAFDLNTNTDTSLQSFTLRNWHEAGGYLGGTTKDGTSQTTISRQTAGTLSQHTTGQAVAGVFASTTTTDSNSTSAFVANSVASLHTNTIKPDGSVDDSLSSLTLFAVGQDTESTQQTVLGSGDSYSLASSVVTNTATTSYVRNEGELHSWLTLLPAPYPAAPDNDQGWDWGVTLTSKLTVGVQTTQGQQVSVGAGDDLTAKDVSTLQQTFEVFQGSKQSWGKHHDVTSNGSTTDTAENVTMDNQGTDSSTVATDSLTLPATGTVTTQTTDQQHDEDYTLDKDSTKSWYNVDGNGAWDLGWSHTTSPGTTGTVGYTLHMQTLASPMLGMASMTLAGGPAGPGAAAAAVPGGTAIVSFVLDQYSSEDSSADGEGWGAGHQGPGASGAMSGPPTFSGFKDTTSVFSMTRDSHQDKTQHLEGHTDAQGKFRADSFVMDQTTIDSTTLDKVGTESYSGMDSFAGAGMGGANAVSLMSMTTSQTNSLYTVHSEGSETVTVHQEGQDQGSGIVPTTTMTRDSKEDVHVEVSGHKTYLPAPWANAGGNGPGGQGAPSGVTGGADFDQTTDSTSTAHLYQETVGNPGMGSFAMMAVAAPGGNGQAASATGPMSGPAVPTTIQGVQLQIAPVPTSVTSFVLDQKGSQTYSIDQDSLKQWTVDFGGQPTAGLDSFSLTKDGSNSFVLHKEAKTVDGRFAIQDLVLDQSGEESTQTDKKAQIPSTSSPGVSQSASEYASFTLSNDSTDSFTIHQEGHDEGNTFVYDSFVLDDQVENDTTTDSFRKLGSGIVGNGEGADSRQTITNHTDGWSSFTVHAAGYTDDAGSFTLDSMTVDGSASQTYHEVTDSYQNWNANRQIDGANVPVNGYLSYHLDKQGQDSYQLHAGGADDANYSFHLDSFQLTAGGNESLTYSEKGQETSTSDNGTKKVRGSTDVPNYQAHDTYTFTETLAGGNNAAAAAAGGPAAALPGGATPLNTVDLGLQVPQAMSFTFDRTIGNSSTETELVDTENNATLTIAEGHTFSFHQQGTIDTNGQVNVLAQGLTDQGLVTQTYDQAADDDTGTFTLHQEAVSSYTLHETGPSSAKHLSWTEKQTFDSQYDHTGTDGVSSVHAHETMVTDAEGDSSNGVFKLQSFTLQDDGERTVHSESSQAFAGPMSVALDGSVPATRTEVYDSTDSFSLSEAGSADSNGVPHVDDFTWSQGENGTITLTEQAAPGASGTLDGHEQVTWQTANTATGSQDDYTFTLSQKEQDTYSSDASASNNGHSYSEQANGGGSTDLEEKGHVTPAGTDITSFTWDDHWHDSGMTVSSDVQPNSTHTETTTYAGHFDLTEEGSKVAGAFQVSSFTLDDAQANTSTSHDSTQFPAGPDGSGGGQSTSDSSSSSSTTEHAAGSASGGQVTLTDYTATTVNDSHSSGSSSGGGGSSSSSSQSHNDSTIQGATPNFTEHTDWSWSSSWSSTDAQGNTTSGGGGDHGSSDGPVAQPGVPLPGDLTQGVSVPFEYAQLPAAVQNRYAEPADTQGDGDAASAPAGAGDTTGDMNTLVNLAGLVLLGPSVGVADVVVDTGSFGGASGLVTGASSYGFGMMGAQGWMGLGGGFGLLAGGLFGPQVSGLAGGMMPWLYGEFGLPLAGAGLLGPGGLLGGLAGLPGGLGAGLVGGLLSLSSPNAQLVLQEGPDFLKGLGAGAAAQKAIQNLADAVRSAAPTVAQAIGQGGTITVQQVLATMQPVIAEGIAKLSTAIFVEVNKGKTSQRDVFNLRDRSPFGPPRIRPRVPRRPQTGMLEVDTLNMLEDMSRAGITATAGCLPIYGGGNMTAGQALQVALGMSLTMVGMALGAAMLPFAAISVFGVIAAGGMLGAVTLGAGIGMAVVGAYWGVATTELRNPNATPEEKIMAAVMGGVMGFFMPGMAFGQVVGGLIGYNVAINNGLSHEEALRSMAKGEVIGGILGGAAQAGLTAWAQSGGQSVLVVTGSGSSVDAFAATTARMPAVGLAAGLSALLGDSAAAFIGYQVATALGGDGWEGANFGMMLGGLARLGYHGARELVRTSVEGGEIAALRSLRDSTPGREQMDLLSANRDLAMQERATLRDQLTEAARGREEALEGSRGREGFEGARGAEDTARATQNCFTGDMLLWTEHGMKRIDTIREGDKVWSQSDATPEGILQLRVVQKVFRRTGVVLNLRVGGQVIRTTGEHPFWVRQRGWVPAAEVQAGDEFLTSERTWVAVEGVEDTGEATLLYNVRVADYHTYYVSASETDCAVWAHNACDELRDFLEMYRQPRMSQADIAEAVRLSQASGREGLGAFREFLDSRGIDPALATDARSAARAESADAMVRNHASDPTWATNQASVENTIFQLGRMALEGGNGNYIVAESLFQTYMRSVNNALEAAGSSWRARGEQAAFADSNGRRAPTWYEADNVDPFRDRAYSGRGTKRLDVALVDTALPHDPVNGLPQVIAGFDISYAPYAPTRPGGYFKDYVGYQYQSAFGRIPIYDIRPPYAGSRIQSPNSWHPFM
jgi:hypothetical protein